MTTNPPHLFFSLTASEKHFEQHISYIDAQLSGRLQFVVAPLQQTDCLPIKLFRD
jgi:hypothetical protein